MDAVIKKNVERSCEELISLFNTTFNIKKAQLITDMHLEVNCFKHGFSPELDSIEKEHKKSIKGLKEIQKELCGMLEKLERKNPKHPYVKINITEKVNGIIIVCGKLFITIRRN